MTYDRTSGARGGGGGGGEPTGRRDTPGRVGISRQKFEKMENGREGEVNRKGERNKRSRDGEKS